MARSIRNNSYPVPQSVVYPVLGPLLLDQSLPIVERAAKLYTVYTTLHEKIMDGQLHVLNPKLVAKVDSYNESIEVNCRHQRRIGLSADEDSLTIKTTPPSGEDTLTLAIVTRRLSAHTGANDKIQVTRYDLKPDGAANVSAATTLAERNLVSHFFLKPTVEPVRSLTEGDLTLLADDYHILIGLDLGSPDEASRR